MKRLDVAALQLMLTFGNKAHLAKIRMCRTVGDVSMMNENGIGGRDIRFFWRKK